MRGPYLALVTITLGSLACGPSANDSAQSSGASSESSGSQLPGASTEPTPGTTSTSGPGATGTLDDTGTSEEGPSVDVPKQPPCMVWETQGCGMATATTQVGGATPLGEFQTVGAVFGANAGCLGYCGGDPNIYRVVLVTDLELVEGLEAWGDTDETLAVEFDQEAPFEGPVGRSVLTRVAASREGVTVYASAEVTFDGLPEESELAEPFDETSAVVVTGSVQTTEEGWDVSGTFEAVYCPTLNTGYICE